MLNEKYSLPSWLFDEEKYNLCLTDDIDSLFSCMVLQQLKRWEVKGFYDFKNICVADGVGSNMIGVDLDLTQGHCFGNHVTKISSKDTINSNAVNINNFEGICKSNYKQKYGGSTLLTILSIYSVDLSYLNEKQLMTLLCVDSAFLGFYYNNNIINKTHKYYIGDVLGYPELLEIEKQHSEKDFAKLKNEYCLNEKIKVIDGKLQTSINLEGLTELFGIPFILPQDIFNNIGVLKNNITNTNNIKNKEDIGSNVFSLAVTSKNTIKYSSIA